MIGVIVSNYYPTTGVSINCFKVKTARGSRSGQKKDKGDTVGLLSPTAKW